VFGSDCEIAAPIVRQLFRRFVREVRFHIRDVLKTFAGAMIVKSKLRLEISSEHLEARIPRLLRAAAHDAVGMPAENA